jgi:hypothetical protein
MAPDYTEEIGEGKGVCLGGCAALRGIEPPKAALPGNGWEWGSCVAAAEPPAGVFIEKSRPVVGAGGRAICWPMDWGTD